jgi:geranylgeranyl pyrophosphate synthase
VTESATAFDLRGFLAEEGGRVEEALERALEALEDHLPKSLLAPARYGVLGGGKRLRPVLCVAAHRACGGKDRPESYDLAVALELFHAYSLMHDDLPCMDDAPLRRGRPTPHRLFGEGPTARAAAALIPFAALRAFHATRALHADPSVARTVVQELARAAGGGGMVGGQVLDLLGEGSLLDEDELDGLHARKTGALLASSLRIGALAAGAPAVTREALDRYGRSIGLAFQVQDDVLDATAAVEVLGKAPSDLALEKSTYVRLHGLLEAERRARLLVDEALQALESGGIDSPPLRGLARYVVERDR